MGFFQRVKNRFFSRSYDGGNTFVYFIKNLFLSLIPIKDIIRDLSWALQSYRRTIKTSQTINLNGSDAIVVGLQSDLYGKKLNKIDDEYSIVIDEETYKLQKEQVNGVESFEGRSLYRICGYESVLNKRSKTRDKVGCVWVDESGVVCDKKINSKGLAKVYTQSQVDLFSPRVTDKHGKTIYSITLVNLIFYLPAFVLRASTRTCRLAISHVFSLVDRVALPLLTCVLRLLVNVCQALNSLFTGSRSHSEIRKLFSNTFKDCGRMCELGTVEFILNDVIKYYDAKIQLASIEDGGLSLPEEELKYLNRKVMLGKGICNVLNGGSFALDLLVGAGDVIANTSLAVSSCLSGCWTIQGKYFSAAKDLVAGPFKDTSVWMTPVVISAPKDNDINRRNSEKDKGQVLSCDKETFKGLTKQMSKSDLSEVGSSLRSSGVSLNHTESESLSAPDFTPPGYDDPPGYENTKSGSRSSCGLNT